MKNIKKIIALNLCAVMIFSFAACRPDYETKQQETEKSWNLSESDMARYNALKTHLENVLTYGRDKTEDASPLFYVGVNVDTKEPAVWPSGFDNEEYVMGNFSMDQNLLRCLTFMSAATGNPKYEKAAADETKYMFKNHVSDLGFIYWGRRVMIDLKNGKEVTQDDYYHESKSLLPDYEFMSQVNPKIIEKYTEAVWGTQIRYYDDKIIMNRHTFGFTKAKNPLRVEKPFEKDYSKDYPVLFCSKKRSFINAGVDMIYGAAYNYLISKDEQALEWAKTLTNMYVKASYPTTGILPYQWSYSGPDNFSDTAYKSDVIYEQLGEEFGPAASSPYCQGSGSESNAVLPMVVFEIYKQVGDKFADLKDVMLQKLKIWKKYAYDAETGKIKYILADGTDLSGYTLKTDGYIGKAGETLHQYTDSGDFVTAYLRAYKLSNDPEFWDVARGLCKAQGLGDIGTAPGKDMQLNMETQNDNAVYLIALVELYENTKIEQYRDLARRIGDNIVAKKFQKGFFTKGQDYLYTEFNDMDASAIAALHASIIGKYEYAPTYIGQDASLEGSMMYNGKKIEQSASANMIFGKKR